MKIVAPPLLSLLVMGLSMTGLSMLAACSGPGAVPAGNRAGAANATAPAPQPTPASQTAGSTASSPTRNTPEQTARTLAGVWRGSYACAQGQTGVDLLLEPDGPTQLRGTFRFYPLERNPNVPRGCFRVTATAGEQGQFRTRAGAWVRQPPGYTTGDIEGSINTDGTLSGNIIPAGLCGGFLLRRTQDEPEPCS